MTAEPTTFDFGAVTPTAVVHAPRASAVVAEMRKHEAMGRTKAHGDPVWRAEASDAVRTVANRIEFFTTDEVWAELDRRNVRPPESPTDMANVMKGSDAIEATAQFRTCTRPSRNGAPVRVWRSLVVSGSEANR